MYTYMPTSISIYIAQPSTLHRQICIMPCTENPYKDDPYNPYNPGPRPQPQTQTPDHQPFNPQPQTLNPKTLNPQP